MTTWATSAKTSDIVVLAEASAIIWPLLAAVPKSSGSKGMLAIGVKLQRGGEVVRLDLRPLRHADLVEDQLRRRVVRARLPQEVDDRLGVARLARSGTAVITTSSAAISVLRTHDVHRCGTSSTTVGTFAWTISSTCSNAPSLKS